jgi:hypothetical protein
MYVYMRIYITGFELGFHNCKFMACAARAANSRQAHLLQPTSA